ncbi:MAG TPA: cytochrome c, partial [SAR86 cluster bacterium]|nr:cytochrome c [SAR86 cluster bacterium]
RDILAPVIGELSPLFGKELDKSEAKELVNLGKLTIQAKNCMNCHTILGNGAYYAPDLTKAWLDKGWGSESVRETLMLSFLLDPETNARSFGTNRKMPNLGMSEEEARGVIAYLKWMSSIDTNGFPAHFESIEQDKESK